MKLTKEQFKRLENEWYERIAQNGFKDIENRKQELMRSTSLKDLDSISKTAIEEYFQKILDIVSHPETTFNNDIDRYIMQRYGEGAFIKHIVDELISLGTPKRRNTIRFIIRRYEMEWNIKKYTDKQLNKYK